MDFRILGAIEVLDGDVRLPLGKPRERAVLAALLLHANEPVSRDRLVDLIWAESPPRSANASVYNCVSRLRRALGADRLAGDGSGYRLIVEPGELDRDRFESLLTDGRAALSAGDADRAAALLGDALSLWRGEPLEDARYEGFAQTEIRRLEELRVSALEARIDAELELGRHAALVAELESLAAAHPWHERFHAQLMLALYRCGRQLDALEAYRSARGSLIKEVGLEPSHELQELERKILLQDATLELLETAAPTGVPAPTTQLIGRERELAELNGLLAEDRSGRILTLVGPGGVGKTRLALELAAATTLQVVFVDLSPLSSVEQVVPAVAHALGVRQTGGESLRAATAARARALGDCLLVMDNCEWVVGAAPVLSALVASSPKLRVLATSREPLHLTGEREYRVEPLSEKDALALFVERSRRVQSSFAADAAAAAICRRLDCLPLALELAAARTNVLSSDQILERLERRLQLLTVGPRDAPVRQQTLTSVIDWSYQLLNQEERALFARMAVFTGGCSLEAAEAVCDADIDALGSLVDKSLVRRRVGRFGMLDTIREFAVGLLEASGEAQELRRRHVEYFLSCVPWDDRQNPELAALVSAEYENLRAGLAWAVVGAPEAALRLAAMLWRTWAWRGMLAEGRYWLERALDAVSGKPTSLRAGALAGATTLSLLAGDLEGTRRLGTASVDVARAVDDPHALVSALNLLGAAAVMDSEYEDARRLYAEAAEVASAGGDDLGLAAVIGNLGTIAACLGRWDEALMHYNDQLALQADWPFAAVTLLNIALAGLQDGQDVIAVAQRYEDVFRRASERGDAIYVSAALHGLGLAAAGAKHSAVAARVLAAAMAEHEKLGYTVELPERLVHDETVESLREELGADAFAAAWSEGGSLSPGDAASLALHSIRGTHAPSDSTSHL